MKLREVTCNVCLLMVKLSWVRLSIRHHLVTSLYDYVRSVGFCRGGKIFLFPRKSPRLGSGCVREAKVKKQQRRKQAITMAMDPVFLSLLLQSSNGNNDRSPPASSPPDDDEDAGVSDGARDGRRRRRSSSFYAAVGSAAAGAATGRRYACTGGIAIRACWN